MRKWMYAVVGVAAAFLVVSIVVASVRQRSIGPAESVAWLPAVLIAVTSRGNRACGGWRGGVRS